MIGFPIGIEEFVELGFLAYGLLEYGVAMEADFQLRGETVELIAVERHTQQLTHLRELHAVLYTIYEPAVNHI